MLSTRPRSFVRRASAVGLGLALVASISACGSSDATKSTGARSSTDTTGAFCDTFLKIDQAAANGDTDTTEGAKKLAVEIAPDVGILQTNTPDALGEQTAVLVKGVEAAAAGKAGALESDAFTKATNQSEAWLHEQCGYQRLDLTAVDYAFDGVPATVQAGKTSIAMTNRSQMGEMHLALLLRPKQGVELDLDQLLALPDDQAESKVDVAAATFAPPTRAGGSLVDLTPGTYYLICPLPVGGKRDGAPHFTKGMTATFTVS